MANGSIYAETRIGDYYFDAFISISHSSSLNITSHPVESGSSIVDHAYLLPREIVMEVAVSDAAVKPLSSFTGQQKSRSVNAYALLRQLQSDRIPLNVYTRLEDYENCLIKNLSVTDSANMVESLKVRVTLVEIPVAVLQRSKISVDWQATEETNNGILEAQQATESELMSIRYRKDVLGINE